MKTKQILINILFAFPLRRRLAQRSGNKKGVTMNPLTQSKNTTILSVQIALALLCFTLSPRAQAVIPAPDGGYANENTAEGDSALFSLTTGFGNTALGFNALFFDTTGGGNTAIGVLALDANTTGPNNTAVGFDALERNTTGQSNTAVGAFALTVNTTGTVNVAVGMEALSGNSTGSFNTAIGTVALDTNSIGSFNTAVGDNAMVSSDTGDNNTAVGQGAMEENVNGSDNTSLGAFALGNNISGSSNIAIGESAGANLTTGSNNIYVGNAGVASDSKTIRIGTTGTHTKAIIAGIFGTPVAGGVGVIVGSGGKLGTVVSSARFKEGVKPMDKASEAILALKPVTFRYKHELDPEAIPQFGLVAEQVEKVNPDLVARDEQGKPYTVRYEAVNAMLLNEFLKEHRTVQEQQKEIDALKAELKEQRSLIQKVSAQLELNKSGPKTVLNVKCQAR
jgi:hypothetical protein